MESTTGRSSDWDVSCDMTGHDSPDLAFKWTPSFTRDYEIAAVGSGFDVVLAVFNEDCTSELQCEDTYGDSEYAEAVNGLFIAGTSYYIVVTGYTFSEEGMVSVTILPSS